MRSLLHIDPTHPTTSLEFISTGLSGEITGYREVTTTADARTAANSTSMERKPADYQGSFVRGKSSYFPFRPGGLGDAILTGEEEDSTEGTPALAVEGLEKAFEKGRGMFASSSSSVDPHAADTRPTPSCKTGGIRTIPPGFTRGLDFGPLADDPTSALIEEEEEEVEVKPIYRPMLELSNEAGRARAITVRCCTCARCSYTSSSRPPPQNGQPEDGDRPQLDAAIEELLPTRVGPRDLSNCRLLTDRLLCSGW